MNFLIRFTRKCKIFLRCHIGLIILLFCYGCNKPQSVTTIFMLDSSLSSANYRLQAIDTVKQMTRRLDSKLDKVVIYKLGEDVYHLYSGEPKRQKMTEIMDVYAQSKSNERGTAYGMALERGMEEIKVADEQGHRTALVFLGDGADEIVKKGGNLSDKELSILYQKFPENALLSFVYIDPRNGDRFRRALYPVLKERLQIISPIEAEDKKALQKFYEWLGR